MRWTSYVKLKGMVFLLMYTQTAGMDAAQATDLLGRIMELSQAATTAATTANQIMEAYNAGGGKGNQGPRFGDGAKLLRAPEVFETDDPIKYSNWREQFLNWLTFCDGRYSELIKDVEQLETMTDMATLDAPVQELAMKLYSILSSYLQGPALQIVRAHATQRNGFAVWHRLKQLYAPRARPRALAIGQAIMQHPAFAPQRSMMENLLQFDALLDQYELAAGHRMPDDLTVSTVLRCLDGPTRRHLEMVMDESMDYAKLKDKLILLDKNTKAWSGDNFLKNLQVFNQPTSTSSTNYQGPTPMEVDQVHYGNKGKNKGKGKSKGKKGSWFGVPYGGKYGGGQKGGGKSKSKNKGKKGGKNKGKGKQQKGKGYGGGSNNTCRICGQYGHWGNECPLRSQVNQVNNAGNASGEAQGVPDSTSATGSLPTRRASTASTASTSLSSTSKAVRLVKMYHVATPPAEHPEIYEVNSNFGDGDADDWYVRMVADTTTLWFRMDAGDTDQPGDVCWSNDPLMDWYHGRSCTLDRCQSGRDEDEIYHVRAVPAGQLVVLDSGADISLLPYHLSGCGIPKPGGRTILEDAQGERLQTFGRRSARVECEGLNNDLVIIEDDFIVASVQSPLISLGRLLHRGWSLTSSSYGGAKMTLVSPDGGAMVPLEFKRNSLAICASIRVVSAKDISEASSSTSLPKPNPVSEPKVEMVVEDENDMMTVQTVIKPKEELLKRIFRRGWATSSSGNPFIIMPASKHYLDPALVYSRSDWPLRSTAFQKEDFTWELVEFCNQYYISDYLDAEIEECPKPTMVLTMLHKRDEPFDVLGLVGEQELVENGGSNADPSAFMFPEEPNIPAEMMEYQKPEEVEQPDRQRARDEPAPIFEWEFANKDTLVVNDEPLTLESSIGFLRAAAEYLGISKNGTKQQLWTRLNQKVQTLEHEQLFLDSNRLYKDEEWKQGLVGQSVPRAPSDEEVAFHELSHLPYRAWCPYCVSCKGKQDPQRPVEHSSDARRSIPSIEVDYCFSKTEESENVSTALVGIDCESKMLTVMPLPSKGANLRGQAEHLVRFSMALNHMNQVEFVSDAEPTMKQLLASVQLLRQHLGYPTTVTHSKPGEKGRTSQVERVIQTLRKQASTLIHMACEKCQLHLPGDHALWPWSFIHGAWLLNRYHNHTTTKMSPFELVNGRRYSGKVASFGEVVLVLHRKGSNTKAGPQWVPGVWLTKSEGDDLHVVATPEGILKGKAIRRLTDPWRSTWLFMVQEKPFQSLSRRATLKNLRFGAPPTPKPVVEKQKKLPDEPIDYDAHDVIEYARTHPPSPVSEADMPAVEDTKRGHEDEPLSSQKFAKLLDSAEGASAGDLVDDSTVREPETKVPKTSPQGSPSSTSSSRLFAPHYAGNIQHVMEVVEIDDEQWEEEVAEYLEPEWVALDGTEEDEHIDEGKPPELSSEELEALDEAAGFEEITRLLAMEVIREPSAEDLEQGAVLSTRSVMDWRFRNQKWQRRCRYVAREFKAGDRGSASTFAPTSGAGARLIMIAHCCYQWLLAFLDVKDAFLLVPQKEKILVQKPSWWLDDKPSRFWCLNRCLPGQRNAAARFFDFLCEHLQSLGMTNTPLLPSLFRHKEKELVLCSHVDDLVVGGTRDAVSWLVKELKSKFTLQGGDLIPADDQDDMEPVRFLKKRHYFTQAGVIISPHEKYADELVKLYGLQHCDDQKQHQMSVGRSLSLRS